MPTESDVPAALLPPCGRSPLPCAQEPGWECSECRIGRRCRTLLPCRTSRGGYTVRDGPPPLKKLEPFAGTGHTIPPRSRPAGKDRLQERADQNSTKSESPVTAEIGDCGNGHTSLRAHFGPRQAVGGRASRTSYDSRIGKRIAHCSGLSAVDGWHVIPLLSVRGARPACYHVLLARLSQGPVSETFLIGPSSEPATSPNAASRTLCGRPTVDEMRCPTGRSAALSRAGR